MNKPNFGQTAVNDSPASPTRIRFAVAANPDFYRTLRARVSRYLDKTEKGRFADRRLIVKAAFYWALVVGAYALMLVRGDNLVAAIFYAMIYGIGTLLLAINLGHDAAHNAVSGRRWVDRLILTLSFIPLGVDSYL